jgi:hypothetical protein
MKFALGLFVFLWVMSGLIGAWMLDDLHPRYWKVIAKGPITLVRAINDNPAHVPGM